MGVRARHIPTPSPASGSRSAYMAQPLPAPFPQGLEMSSTILPSRGPQRLKVGVNPALSKPCR